MHPFIFYNHVVSVATRSQGNSCFTTHLAAARPMIFLWVHGISILRSFEFKKHWIYSVHPKMYGNFGENDDEPIESGVPHFWISASKISWSLTFSHFELIGQIPPKTIGTKHTRFCRLGCSGLIQLRHNFHTSTLPWVSSITINHHQSSSIIINHPQSSSIIIHHHQSSIINHQSSSSSSSSSSSIILNETHTNHSQSSKTN